MQTRIKIIKRGAPNGRTDASRNRTLKSERERERETVATVKTWIADWHDRKQSLQEAADSLISSMGLRRGTPRESFSPELT